MNDSKDVSGKWLQNRYLWGLLINKDLIQEHNEINMFDSLTQWIKCIDDDAWTHRMYMITPMAQQSTGLPYLCLPTTSGALNDEKVNFI